MDKLNIFLAIKIIKRKSIVGDKLCSLCDGRYNHRKFYEITNKNTTEVIGISCAVKAGGSFYTFLKNMTNGYYDYVDIEKKQSSDFNLN